MEDITTDEASELMHLSPSRVRQICKEGELSARKLGRKWLIPKSAVEEWLRKNTTLQESQTTITPAIAELRLKLHCDDLATLAGKLSTRISDLVHFGRAVSKQMSYIVHGNVVDGYSAYYDTGGKFPQIEGRPVKKTDPLSNLNSASSADLLNHFNKTFPHMACLSWESITKENADPGMSSALRLLAEEKIFEPCATCPACKNLQLV